MYNANLRMFQENCQLYGWSNHVERLGFRHISTGRVVLYFELEKLSWRDMMALKTGQPASYFPDLK